MMDSNRNSERLGKHDLDALRDFERASRSAVTSEEDRQRVLDKLWNAKQADRERCNQWMISSDAQDRAARLMSERLAAMSMSSMQTGLAAMDRLLKMEQRVNNALDNPRSGGYPSALPRTDEHGSLTNTEVEALIDARVKNAIVGVLQTLDAIEHPDDDVLA